MKPDKNKLLSWAKRNIKLFNLPAEDIHTITLAVAGECNLRCRMCDIWKQNPLKEEVLSIGVLNNIFISKKLKKLKCVNFTGGEPFMRGDFEEVYKNFTYLHPKANCVISSNGFFTDRIVNFFRRAGKTGRISLELSLLGLKTHNFIVQNDAALLCLNETVLKIKKLFPDLSIAAKFTITPWNYSEIEETVGYCNKIKLPVYLKMIENVKSYTNHLNYEKNALNKEFLFTDQQKENIVNSLLKVKGKSANGDFVGLLIKKLKFGYMHSSCFVNFNSMFINYNGEVYRCRELGRIGNIGCESLDAMITASSAKAAGFNGKNPKCLKCDSLYRALI